MSSCHRIPRIETAGSSPDTIRSGIGTVLVVDDDPQVRMITLKLLEWAGYQTIEAACGTEALACFESYEAAIDLVLTDVMMPDMSGYELAERLTANGSSVRFIYMSGHISALTPGNPPHAAPGLHISKPFTVDDLVHKIEEALNGG